MTYRKILSCAAGLAVAAAAQANINLLENAGFETGELDPWLQIRDLGGPENWNVTDQEARSGTYSATNLGNKLIGQFFAEPVNSNEILEANFWLKNSKATINAVTWIYEGNQESETVYNAPDTEWNLVDALPFLQPNRNVIGIGVYGFINDGNEDRTWVDDWRVMVVPGPGATALLTLGTLCAARRRR